MAVAKKQAKSGDYDWIGELLGDLCKVAWAFRTELALLSPLPAIYLQLSRPAGNLFACVVIGLVVSLALATGPTRRWIARRLYTARLRRKWARACEDVELAAPNGRLPIVRRARKTPAGDQLVVRVPRGGSVEEVERRGEKLAATFGVREVRVTRHEDNAAFATVVIVKQDSLDAPEPLAWPAVDADVTSLWQPIPVGIDEDGNTVTVELPERNVLIGGEPGAGKSAALSMLVASAALDPAVKMWLLDGKRVELAVWSPLAEQTVGPSIGEAIELLRSLQTEMEKRYEFLLEQKLRKIDYWAGPPLHMVVCDELAFYLTNSDRKKRTEFGDLMRDMVSRGRAAGIIVVAATQKPSHDVIPTSLRDLFGFRWAMRCNTPQASDTILGSGWASQGYDASTIPGSQRGVGYLHTEDAKPVRLRSCYLGNHELEQIAGRAQRLRTPVDGGG